MNNQVSNNKLILNEYWLWWEGSFGFIPIFHIISTKSHSSIQETFYEIFQKVYLHCNFVSLQSYSVVPYSVLVSSQWTVLLGLILYILISSKVRAQSSEGYVNWENGNYWFPKGFVFGKVTSTTENICGLYCGFLLQILLFCIRPQYHFCHLVYQFGAEYIVQLESSTSIPAQWLNQFSISLYGVSPLVDLHWSPWSRPLDQETLEAHLNATRQPITIRLAFQKAEILKWEWVLVDSLPMNNKYFTSVDM